MAKEKERLITVTANDQNRTIKLENPNLKIVSKQGDQISIHSFFDLFSTIDKTKKIKKQLDKEVSMLKTIKLSFQRKLNKFKSAKLFSIRKLKDQENYLMRHYEEIVAKMKAKAHEEISAQFSEFKQEIAEEKNKLVNEIATENETITKNIQTAEENLSAQFSKLEKVIEKTKANTIETLASIQEETIIDISSKSDEINEQLATLKKELLEEKENLNNQFAKTEKLIKETKANTIEVIEALQKETIVDLDSRNDEISNKLFEFKQEIVEGKTELSSQLFEFEKIIDRSQSDTIETISSLHENTILEINSKKDEANAAFLGLKKSITEDKTELFKEIESQTNASLTALTNESNKFADNLKSIEEKITTKHSTFEKTLEKTKFDTLETIASFQNETIFEINTKKDEATATFLEFKKVIAEDKTELFKEIDSQTSASLTTLTNESNRFSDNLKTMEENLTTKQSALEKTLEITKLDTLETIASFQDETILEINTKKDETTAAFLEFKKVITEDKTELFKEIESQTNASLAALTNESHKFSDNLKAMEKNLVSQHSSFEKILEKTQTGAVENIISLQDDTVLEIQNNSKEILEQLSIFNQTLIEEKDKIISDIDSRTAYSLSALNTENINLSNDIKIMEKNLISLHSNFEKSFEDTREKTKKEIDIHTSSSLAAITNESTKLSSTLKTMETNLISQRSAFEKAFEKNQTDTLKNIDTNNKLIDDKIKTINTTAEALKTKLLLEIEEAKKKALQELDDTGTSRENFKKFTQISQDYIHNSIKSAISEVEIVKASLSLEIAALSDIANKEILDIRESAKDQSIELKADLNLLKDTIQEEITKLQETTADELKSISKLSKQESSENLKTILSNIEEFSNKTKLEIADLTKKFDADQDTMLNNTYKDLQILQTKLQEIDKTEDMKAINEEFIKLKKQNELTLEDIKTSTNQSITKSIEELFNKMKTLNASNKQELQLAKDQISEHEQLFYKQVQQKVDDILKASQAEQEQQLQLTSDKVNELKQETQQEIKLIKQELNAEKVQMIETAMDDLNTLKINIHNKAENQITEATTLLQSFKISFEKSQKELLTQNKEQFQKLEQEATLSLQEKISSVKTYIEEIKNDSIRNIYEITKDVENEQKVLNKLIVQVKSIKTTLETGIFADLDSTIQNIESIKQSHTLEMDSLKKENQKTQQESIRQLKIMVEETINTQLQQTLDKIAILQEQLQTEKTQLSESSTKLNKQQSETKQDLYEQLEQTLTNVNSIKEEAETSIKQLKSESFTEILSVKKSLNQVISYLKKQKAQSEKKLLSPTIITKKGSQDQDELINMLIKEGLSL